MISVITIERVLASKQTPVLQGLRSLSGGHMLSYPMSSSVVTRKMQGGCCLGWLMLAFTRFLHRTYRAERLLMDKALGDF